MFYTKAKKDVLIQVEFIGDILMPDKSSEFPL